jgi:hypothetical protein
MRTSCAIAIVCLVSVFHSAPLPAQVNVLTWHNDKGRSGANTEETTLTTTNVTKTSFGKICSAPVDGAMNAQPLIVTGVPFTVKGNTTTHDVAYVATENDTLYAFDANTCVLLKAASMVPLVKGCTPGVTCEQPVDCKSIGGGGCLTIAPTIGILSTPVIDAASGVNNGTTGTIYLVAETQIGAGGTPSAWKHRIHALDITTLAERRGSPAVIQGSFGTMTFHSGWQIQRPGLLLLRGAGPDGDNMVYTAFSLMDGAPGKLGLKPPGWVFGYDTTTLDSQPAGLPYIFNTTPNGVGPNGPGGGIWQAGAGLAGGFASATDPSQYIYVGTGDGTWDAGSGGSDYADSFLKLAPNLSVAGFFTRYNETAYATADKDWGSGGMMLVPDNTFSDQPYLSVNAGKDGNIYVIDRGSPGGYNGVSNTNVETVAGKLAYFGTPAFWNRHLYNSVVGGGVLKSWTMSASCNPGPVCTTGIRFSKVTFPFGTTPAVSSNGTTAGTGIVWAIASPDQVNGGVAAILYAVDAIKLVKLYDTGQCGTQDVPGLAVKFTVPSIANGKVYIGTQSELDVYGLLPTRSCPLSTGARIIGVRKVQ